MVDQRLDERVVDAGGDAAHRAEQPGLPESVPEDPGRVLSSAVGVNHGSGRGAAAPAGHLERIDDDLGGDPVRDRPAHDPAGERVDHRGTVNPSVSRAVLRNIAEPEPVRRVGAELPLHEILVSCGVRLPPAPFASMRHPGQTIEAHQPCDALLPDVNTEPEPQLGQHPRGTIGAARLPMDSSDRGRERRVSDRARRRRPSDPFVVARGRHPEEPAGHRDGNPVRGELLDQPEPYFGSTFSRAKYADARLSISFSISSTRSRRRNSTSSRCSSVVTPGLRPESIASRFIQFLRHDSLIPRSRAVCATGLPCATKSKALRRNSGG